MRVVLATHSSRILGKVRINVKSSTVRLFKKDLKSKSALLDEETEIAAVVHALRDQACTLGLGISALQYPEESEQERQQHIAILEEAVEEMSREFQRLDQWLMQVGYKHKLGEPLLVARERRLKRQAVRA
jgi:hypothetical protein